jgi:enamine deaminase RidA (YjgF/YER057c/UK114 family)
LPDSPTETLPPRHEVEYRAAAFGWPRPKGYANGIKARGDLLFIGGMVGWDARGRFPADFVGQTRQLFSNIIAILTRAAHPRATSCA